MPQENGIWQLVCKQEVANKSRAKWSCAYRPYDVRGGDQCLLLPRLKPFSRNQIPSKVSYRMNRILANALQVPVHLQTKLINKVSKKIASSPTLTSKFSGLTESGLRSTFTHPEGKENRGNSSTSDLKISTLGQIVCKTKLWISWRATWQLTTIINNNNYKEFPSVFPCFQQLQT